MAQTAMTEQMLLDVRSNVVRNPCLSIWIDLWQRCNLPKAGALGLIGHEEG